MSNKARSRRIVLTATLATVVLTTGVAVGTHSMSKRSDPAHGPLGSVGGVILDDPNLVSILAPGEQPWTATFGVLQLCTRGSTDLTMESMDVHFAGSPVPHRVAVRSVRQGDSSLDATASSTQPMAELGGTLAQLQGFRVTTPCAERTPRVFDEVLLELSVDQAGAEVEMVEITYTDGTRTFTYRDNWRYVACGEDQEKNLCTPRS